MRTKIEKLVMICIMAFGSFLFMMSLISHNAEAVSEWSIEIVDSVGDVGKYNSITVDSNNRPHISYFDETNDDLKYAYWDGSSWQIETVDSDGSVGWYSAIAIDANNRPHISYFAATNDDLKYAYWDGSSWQIETVDSDGSVGWYSAIAIDANNRPHISYFDETNDDLKYAYWDGSSWQIETVASDGSVGWYSAIAIDANNRPHISYFDETNDDLKYVGAVPDTESAWTCFIATAAYASSMEPHVEILRKFRDRFLLNNIVGKAFVDFYYKYSPPIADFIANHDSLRAMVRLGLLPFIGASWLALKIGPVSTMALILFFAFGLIGLVRVRKKFNR